MANKKTDLNAECMIGTGHDAFKKSKGSILSWINGFYGIGYEKVEQAWDGAICCQIMDSLFPEVMSTAMWKKVRWDVVNQCDAEKNWKIVQQVLIKLEIKWKIPIAGLCDANFKQNLEFMQWMNHLFGIAYKQTEYDALSRRTKGKQSDPKIYVADEKSKNTLKLKTARKKKYKKSAAGKGKTATPTTKKGNPESVKIETQIDTLEKERNFYFTKLREIEIMCQTGDDKVSIISKKKLLSILYQKDANGEFQQPKLDPNDVEDDEPEDDTF